MNNKYQPKFKPEVYLRFLNQKDVKTYKGVSGSTILEIPPKMEKFISKNNKKFRFFGMSIEECLDQAILATEFEKG